MTCFCLFLLCEICPQFCHQIITNQLSCNTDRRDFVSIKSLFVNRCNYTLYVLCRGLTLVTLSAWHGATSRHETRHVSQRAEHPGLHQLCDLWRWQELTADWMRITWDWQIADANMLIAAGIQLIMMKCCHIYADLQHVYVNPLLRSWVMYNIVLWIDPPTFLHNQLIVAVLWDFGWRWMFMIIMQVK